MVSTHSICESVARLMKLLPKIDLPRGPALRVKTHVPDILLAIARRPSGLRDKSHIDLNIPTFKSVHM